MRGGSDENEGEKDKRRFLIDLSLELPRRSRVRLGAFEVSLISSRLVPLFFRKGKEKNRSRNKKFFFSLSPTNTPKKVFDSFEGCKKHF